MPPGMLVTEAVWRSPWQIKVRTVWLGYQEVVWSSTSRQNHLLPSGSMCTKCCEAPPADRTPGRLALQVPSGHLTFQKQVAFHQCPSISNTPTVIMLAGFGNTLIVPSVTGLRRPLWHVQGSHDARWRLTGTDLQLKKTKHPFGQDWRHIHYDKTFWRQIIRTFCSPRNTCH